MTLLQMQYFMEVCRCGSTLKAAQAANVSQSTISMAIRALEKELSIPLFDRSSKGLAPNAAGSFFLDQCSGILKKTERLAEEMKQFLSISRPLRLGIPVVLNEFYWLDLYFELKNSFPIWNFRRLTVQFRFFYLCCAIPPWTRSWPCAMRRIPI